ncbi:MAG: hypothetical protein A2063_06995 [Gallionellales bacterium GWA2_60_142]|nr:MAG: hypothetical protein A2063_06995 [Gallionellales bacterium GWA2_60_142]HCI14740.1 hypothetical protein [Gallionellaceae bacterium]
MTHTWNFFRAGGFDQVQIDSGADLLALRELDQKLWAALSCPTRGIEFDARTLDMIDSDGDGHVRPNEVLEAIVWAGGMLRNPDLLIDGSDRLNLSDINDNNDAGRELLASARHVLKSLGKSDAQEISLADMDDVEKLVASQKFNGDGVVCAEDIADEALRATVGDIVACAGSSADVSGQPGITGEIAGRFFDEAAAYEAWHAQGEGDAAVLFLGENTAAAARACAAVRDKIDDYFTRCRLAAYDIRAAAPLSRAVEDYQQLAAKSLSAQSAEVADFPLATVAANKPLPLLAGVNPAWQARLEAFRAQVVQPLLGDMDALDDRAWAALCARFAAFDAWQANKPQGNVERLGIDRIREIISAGRRQQIEALIAQDKAVEAEVRAIRSVEKLLHYKRDLFKLVNNFVSFRNFYTGRDKAIFQAGTLYLDGRSCELCVKVEDVNKHAVFASMSGACLVYCDCVRSGGTEKMSIVVAFTSGDSDFLTAGRNGIFYDRKGRDWNAQIVRIIDNPISIRQAFWSPYKKLAKAISEQFQKFAASKVGAVDDKMLKSVAEGGKGVSDPATPKPPFDIGKFAGIFAAIGLAIGAIGGILASVVGGVLGLKFWQIPLALIGLMLLISGPSMAMAWFKLKRRNLGPILDACGWAINARAYINIPFGTSLTALADLPKGANRSLVDPYAERHVVWPYYLVIAMGIVSLIGLWYVGFFG